MSASALKKPEWLKVSAPRGESYLQIKKLARSLNLATVCEEANCPNISECWSGGTATFMLMGDVCTRGCRFCNVKTGNPKGVLDSKEPENLAQAISQMGLDYVVLTSVNRDDLEDDGSSHFAKSIEYLKGFSPDLLIEVLTPDFRGKADCILNIVKAKPHVFAHNMETVRSLTSKVRDKRANYDQSLFVLDFVKQQDPSIYTKTSLMLGLGESDEEILQTLKDLRMIDCDILTFGQYLQPQKRHLKVENYVSPKKFEFWKQKAEEMGFLYCASGPLVRSSYRAGEFFMKGLIKNDRN